MPDLEELNKHRPVVGKVPTIEMATHAKGTVNVDSAAEHVSYKAKVAPKDNEKPTEGANDEQASTGESHYPTTPTKEDVGAGKPTQESTEPSKKSEQSGDRREDEQDSNQDRKQGNEAEENRKREEERRRKENENSTNKNKDNTEGNRNRESENEPGNRSGKGEGGSEGPGKGGPEAPGGRAGAGESGFGSGAGGAGEGLVSGGAGGATGAGAAGGAGAVGGTAAAGGGAVVVEGGAVVAGGTVEIWGTIALVVLAIILILIGLAYVYKHTGLAPSNPVNPITQHEDVLTTLAKTGNASARQQLMKTKGTEVIAALQQQADSETDAINKKTIQTLIDALKALKPNVDYTVDYSAVPQPTGTDQSAWSEKQKERQARDDVETAYTAYQKIASKLTAFAAANTLIAWVNAHPQAANQSKKYDAYRTSAHGLPTAQSVIGKAISGNCWNTVWYVLQVVFPGSNGRGVAGQWLDRGTKIPSVGQGPTPTDFAVAQKTLAAGQLPVWHVQGTVSGQHWIIVVAVDATTNTVSEFDPAYGKIVTLSPSKTNGPAWASSLGGNYLGYSDQGDSDDAAFQRGFPFTPAKSKTGQ